MTNHIDAFLYVNCDQWGGHECVSDVLYADTKEGREALWDALISDVESSFIEMKDLYEQDRKAIDPRKQHIHIHTHVYMCMCNRKEKKPCKESPRTNVPIATAKTSA